ncbi:MAG: hypothetical protein ACRD04_14695 [Terriglobales bacterium]
MRRHWIIAAICLAVALGAVWLWWAMPPASVRRLPPGQTLVYLRLKPVRKLWALRPAPPPATEYATFVRESGFDYQRDLDSIALSMNGNPLRPRDATAIFSGRFGPKFTLYLQRHALARTRVAGVQAYRFAGWARPQQKLTVARLGARELLITNAADAAPIVAHARAWWTPAPGRWRAGNDWRLLLGYCDVNAERLEAQRALDGSQPPWQGIESLELRLSAGSSGLKLSGRAQTANAEQAQAAQAWLKAQIQELRPLLQDQTGDAGLGALLDRLESGVAGDQAWVRLQIDPAMLAQWSQVIAHR